MRQMIYASHIILEHNAELAQMASLLRQWKDYYCQTLGGREKRIAIQNDLLQILAAPIAAAPFSPALAATYRSYREQLEAIFQEADRNCDEASRYSRIHQFQVANRWDLRSWGNQNDDGTSEKAAASPLLDQRIVDQIDKFFVIFSQQQQSNP